MNTPNKIVIQIVQEYIEKNHSDICIRYEYGFEESCYSKWAAKEILNILRKKDTVPPLILLEDFMWQMKEYSILNDKNSFIFLIAYKTTEYFIDLIL